MSDGATFIDLAVRGQVSLTAIDDFVDAWHNSANEPGSLHAWLGMTAAEYERWLRAPDTLADIVANRTAAAARLLGDARRA
jgi:hypothetical protein